MPPFVLKPDPFNPGQEIEVDIDLLPQYEQEVAKLGAPQTESPSLLAAFGRGAMEAPSAFLESWGGIKPLLQAGKELAFGDRTEGLKDVAQLGAGTGGAMAGGALGALGGPLSPITVPLGAYAGGTLAGIGADVARRALEGEPLPTGEEMAYSAGQGAPLAGLSGGIGFLGKLKKGGYALPERLEAKAVGVTKAQMARSAKQRGIGELGEVELGEAVQRILRDPQTRKQAADPLALKNTLESQMDALGNRINSEVSRLEEARKGAQVTTPVAWENTTKLIEKYRGSGGLEEVQAKALETINNIAAETNLKTLTGLNEARQALNKRVYGPTDPLYVNEVTDAIRADIRNAQLKAAKAVDPESTIDILLKDYGDRRQIVDKVLVPKVAGESVTAPIPRALMRTSGGFGVPLLLGSATDFNPLAIGAPMAASFMFENPKGQMMLADILRGQTAMRGTGGALQRALGAGRQQYSLEEIMNARK